MGKAVACLPNHWDGLKLFLENGGVEMDTNLVENQIGPLTPARENAFFAGRSWARLASLIATRELNDVESHAWMKATLEAIANGLPRSRVDEPTPWASGREAPAV
jgi:transposase